MSDRAGTSESNLLNDEYDDVFEDSSFFNNLEDTLYKEMASRNNDNNKSLDNNALNISRLSSDKELSGYDKLLGKTWIYPTNYPVRDYQFNIIKAAILKNTLVSLPTGLGKTFIAAVIMYNFYRWYPTCKIVFTAPTRPLVAQQIEACYNICAIPQSDTVEMTGHMQVNTRKQHWQNKRVFFATPQVIYNDIKSGICPGQKIRCLVFDEAHKARGNYAYCQIVSTLDDMKCTSYRIVALSATPGSKIEDVVNVVKSLHIAHLELRTENCIDVAPYNHSRRISTVIIPLGPELNILRQRYLEILNVYARKLKEINILPANIGNVSKGRVVMLYKEFQARDKRNRHPQHNYIMKDFVLLISLFHGLELLTKHGSRVFLNFFDEHPEKPWMQSDDQLTGLLERLRDDLGLNPMSLNTSILPDGTIPEIPKDLRFGHPKFDKLKEIMLQHFETAKNKGLDTRAIVFCEYRESVNLVNCLLLQCRPLIKPQTFVGQGASGKDGKIVISQKQQLRVMQSFRSGSCNTLVATCVAEEGLDVGRVDLILCFDISTRSPIRLVQRCGRTGRERGGQVYILVTEGKEHQTLLDCMRQRDGLAKRVLQSKEVEANLYKANQRMIPRDHTPECLKMHITVTKKPDVVENTNAKAKKGYKDIRAMLFEKQLSDKSITPELTKEQFDKLYPEGLQERDYFKAPGALFLCDTDTINLRSQMEGSKPSWFEWQRNLQSTVNVDHSSDSKILSELLQYCDTKRLEPPVLEPGPSNIPPVQCKSPTKQKETKRKQKTGTNVSPVKRDGDIRALFSTAVKSTKHYTKILNDLGLQSESNVPTAIIDVLVELNIDDTKVTTPCDICDSLKVNKSLIDIKKFNTKVEKKPLTFLTIHIIPDINWINDIDAKAIKDFVSSNKFKDLDFVDDYLDKPFDDDNFDKPFVDDLEPDIVKNCSDFQITPSKTIVELHANTDTNFDLGNIEDIFENSSPEEPVVKIDSKIGTAIECKPKEALDYFGLDSIDDIFADDQSEDSVQLISVSESNLKPNNHEENNNQIDNPPSPSILSGTFHSFSESPIKGTQMQTKDNIQSKQVLPELSKCERSFIENSTKQNNLLNTSKSMFTVTQLVEMINNTSRDKSKCTSHIVENNVDNIEDNDRCMSPIILTQADKNKSIQMNNPTLFNTKYQKSQFDVNISNLEHCDGTISPILLTQADKNKSMDMINKSLNKSKCKDQISRIDINHDNDEHCNGTTSPILLTQSDKRNMSKNSDSSFNRNSIIIPDSSSDTDEYDFTNKLISITDSQNSKRKEREVLTSSPYFNKKLKPNNYHDHEEPPMKSVQDKIKNILSLNKNKGNKVNDNKIVNFVNISPLKENLSPIQSLTVKNDDKDESEIKLSLTSLQMFRRDNTSKINGLNSKSSNNENKLNSQHFSESSDDDFEKSYISTKSVGRSSVTKAKDCRKNKLNEFLDLEAELDCSKACGSGDELTDESLGSLVDFICDDDNLTQEDIHEHYLESIKQKPVPGKFKIPQLPNLRPDVFSQAVVEDDDYEMDSFCVDSHVGLTQEHNMCELELAEKRLRNLRKKRKKRKVRDKTLDVSESEAEMVLKKRKRIRISSDSNDSN